MDRVRANFEVSFQSLVDLVFKKFGIMVPMSTMYKARAEAVKQIQGVHEESYGQLPHYVYVVKEKTLMPLPLLVGLMKALYSTII